MNAAGPAADFDTVILAGGSAARMAGADKPALTVGGAPMLVSVAQAASAAGTQQLIVVGPRRPGAVQAGLEKVAAGQPTLDLFPLAKERLPEFEAWKAAKAATPKETKK